MRTPLLPLLKALLAVLPVALVACGPDQPQGAPANAASEELPAAAGRGLLETIDPQDPARPRFHDFGELIFGDQLTWPVRFRNSGEGPLKILSAQAACGCTRLAGMTIRPAGGGPPRVIKSFRGDVIATVPAGAELEVSIEVITSFTAPNQRKLALFRMTTDSDLEPYDRLAFGRGRHDHCVPIHHRTR